MGPYLNGEVYRVRTYVALRGVMQALVRIQAYMLADIFIVVAIPAVDLAIEAVV
jgi:hypothetical protein